MMGKDIEKRKVKNRVYVNTGKLAAQTPADAKKFKALYGKGMPLLSLSGLTKYAVWARKRWGGAIIRNEIDRPSKAKLKRVYALEG